MTLRWKKIIAALLAVWMLYPSLSWAFTPDSYALANVSLLENAGFLKWANKLGAILQTHRAGEKTIVYIQDLHCNYEVQKNIAGLVEKLAQDHELSLVAVEGASKPVNVTRLRRISTEWAKKEICDYLLQQGELTGPEFFAAIGSQRIRLEGIENPQLYAASLALVKKFMSEESQGYLEELREALQGIKTKLYSPGLAAVDEPKQAYRAGRLTLLAYALQLKKLAAAQGLNLDAYPQFQEYTRPAATSLTGKVDSEILIQELALLDHGLRQPLYHDPQAAELDRLEEKLDICEKLLNISATNNEVAGVAADPSGFKIRTFVDFIQRQNNDGADSVDPEVFKLDDCLAQTRQFYALASQRSSIFVQNLIAKISSRQDRVAVLVAGGFHSAEILNELGEKGYSYICIKPRLEHQDVVNPYFNLLRDKPTVLEKLLEKNQNILSPISRMAQTEDPDDPKIDWGSQAQAAQRAKQVIDQLDIISRIVVQLEKKILNNPELTALAQKVREVADSRVVIVNLAQGLSLILRKPGVPWTKAEEKSSLVVPFKLHGWHIALAETSAMAGLEKELASAHSVAWLSWDEWFNLAKRVETAFAQRLSLLREDVRKTGEGVLAWPERTARATEAETPAWLADKMALPFVLPEGGISGFIMQWHNWVRGIFGRAPLSPAVYAQKAWKLETAWVLVAGALLVVLAAGIVAGVSPRISLADWLKPEAVFHLARIAFGTSLGLFILSHFSKTPKRNLKWAGVITGLGIVFLILAWKDPWLLAASMAAWAITHWGINRRISQRNKINVQDISQWPQDVDPDGKVQVKAVVADLDNTLSPNGFSPPTKENLEQIAAALRQGKKMLLISGAPLMRKQKIRLYKEIIPNELIGFEETEVDYGDMALEGRFIGTLREYLEDAGDLQAMQHLTVKGNDGMETAVFNSRGEMAYHAESKHLSAAKQLAWGKALAIGYLREFGKQHGIDFHAAIVRIAKATRSIHVRELFAAAVAGHSTARLDIYQQQMAMVNEDRQVSSSEIEKQALAWLDNEKFRLNSSRGFSSSGPLFSKLSQVQKSQGVLAWLGQVKGPGVVLALGDSTVDDFLWNIKQPGFFPFYLGKRAEVSAHPQVIVAHSADGMDGIKEAGSGNICRMFLEAESKKVHYRQVPFLDGQRSLDDLEAGQVLFTAGADAMNSKGRAAMAAGGAIGKLRIAKLEVVAENRVRISGNRLLSTGEPDFAHPVSLILDITPCTQAQLGRLDQTYATIAAKGQGNAKLLKEREIIANAWSRIRGNCTEAPVTQNPELHGLFTFSIVEAVGMPADFLFEAFAFPGGIAYAQAGFNQVADEVLEPLLLHEIGEEAGYDHGKLRGPGEQARAGKTIPLAQQGLVAEWLGPDAQQRLTWYLQRRKAELVAALAPAAVPGGQQPIVLLLNQASVQQAQVWFEQIRERIGRFRRSTPAAEIPELASMGEIWGSGIKYLAGSLHSNLEIDLNSSAVCAIPRKTSLTGAEQYAVLQDAIRLAQLQGAGFQTLFVSAGDSAWLKMGWAIQTFWEYLDNQQVPDVGIVLRSHDPQTLAYMLNTCLEERPQAADHGCEIALRVRQDQQDPAPFFEAVFFPDAFSGVDQSVEAMKIPEADIPEDFDYTTDQIEVVSSKQHYYVWDCRHDLQARSDLADMVDQSWTALQTRGSKPSRPYAHVLDLEHKVHPGQTGDAFAHLQWITRVHEFLGDAARKWTTAARVLGSGNISYQLQMRLPKPSAVLLRLTPDFGRPAATSQQAWLAAVKFLELAGFDITLHLTQQSSDTEGSERWKVEYSTEVDPVWKYLDQDHQLAHGWVLRCGDAATLAEALDQLTAKFPEGAAYYVLARIRKVGGGLRYEAVLLPGKANDIASAYYVYSSGVPTARPNTFNYQAGQVEIRAGSESVAFAALPELAQPELMPLVLRQFRAYHQAVQTLLDHLKERARLEPLITLHEGLQLGELAAALATMEERARQLPWIAREPWERWGSVVNANGPRLLIACNPQRSDPAHLRLWQEGHSTYSNLEALLCWQSGLLFLMGRGRGYQGRLAIGAVHEQAETVLWHMDTESLLHPVWKAVDQGRVFKQAVVLRATNPDALLVALQDISEELQHRGKAGECVLRVCVSRPDLPVFEAVLLPERWEADEDWLMAPVTVLNEVDLGPNTVGIKARQIARIESVGNAAETVKHAIDSWPKKSGALVDPEIPAWLAEPEIPEGGVSMLLMRWHNGVRGWFGLEPLGLQTYARKAWFLETSWVLAFSGGLVIVLATLLILNPASGLQLSHLATLRSLARNATMAYVLAWFLLKLLHYDAGTPRQNRAWASILGACAMALLVLLWISPYMIFAIIPMSYGIHYGINRLTRIPKIRNQLPGEIALMLLPMAGLAACLTLAVLSHPGQEALTQGAGRIFLHLLPVLYAVIFDSWHARYVWVFNPTQNSFEKVRKEEKHTWALLALGMGMGAVASLSVYAAMALALAWFGTAGMALAGLALGMVLGLFLAALVRYAWNQWAVKGLSRWVQLPRGTQADEFGQLEAEHASKDIHGGSDFWPEMYSVVNQRAQTVPVARKQEMTGHVDSVYQQAEAAAKALQPLLGRTKAQAAAEKLKHLSMRIRVASQIQNAISVKHWDGRILDIILDASLDPRLAGSTILHESVEAVLESMGIRHAHPFAFMVETELYPESLGWKLDRYDWKHLWDLVTDIPKILKEMKSRILSVDTKSRKLEHTRQIGLLAAARLPHEYQENVMGILHLLYNDLDAFWQELSPSRAFVPANLYKINSLLGGIRKSGVADFYATLQKLYAVDPEHVVRPMGMEGNSGYWIEQIPGSFLLSDLAKHMEPGHFYHHWTYKVGLDDMVEVRAEVPADLQWQMRQTLQRLHAAGYLLGALGPDSVLIVDGGNSFKLLAPAAQQLPPGQVDEQAQAAWQAAQAQEMLQLEALFTSTTYIPRVKVPDHAEVEFENLQNLLVLTNLEYQRNLNTGLIILYTLVSKLANKFQSNSNQDISKLCSAVALLLSQVMVNKQNLANLTLQFNPDAQLTSQARDLFLQQAVVNLPEQLAWIVDMLKTHAARHEFGIAEADVQMLETLRVQIMQLNDLAFWAEATSQYPGNYSYYLNTKLCELSGVGQFPRIRTINFTGMPTEDKMPGVAVGQLEQALEQIILAAGQAGVAEIDIYFVSGSDWFRVLIEADGEWLDKFSQEHFLPYQQGRPFNLGYAMCQKVAELNHGRFWAGVSRDNKNRVVLEFPLLPKRAGADAAQDQSWPSLRQGGATDSTRPGQGRAALLKDWTRWLWRISGRELNADWYDEHVVMIETVWVAILAALGLLLLPHISGLAGFLPMDNLAHGIESWFKLVLVTFVGVHLTSKTPPANRIAAGFIAAITGLLWLALPQAIPAAIQVVLAMAIFMAVHKVYNVQAQLQSKTELAAKGVIESAAIMFGVPAFLQWLKIRFGLDFISLQPYAQTILFPLFHAFGPLTYWGNSALFRDKKGIFLATLKVVFWTSWLWWFGMVFLTIVGAGLHQSLPELTQQLLAANLWTTSHTAAWLGKVAPLLVHPVYTLVLAYAFYRWLGIRLPLAAASVESGVDLMTVRNKILLPEADHGSPRLALIELLSETLQPMIGKTEYAHELADTLVRLKKADLQVLFDHQILTQESFDLLCKNKWNRTDQTRALELAPELAEALNTLYADYVAQKLPESAIQRLVLTHLLPAAEVRRLQGKYLIPHNSYAEVAAALLSTVTEATLQKIREEVRQRELARLTKANMHYYDPMKSPALNHQQREAWMQTLDTYIKVLLAMNQERSIASFTYHLAESYRENDGTPGFLVALQTNGRARLEELTCLENGQRFKVRDTITRDQKYYLQLHAMDREGASLPQNGHLATATPRTMEAIYLLAMQNIKDELHASRLRTTGHKLLDEMLGFLVMPASNLKREVIQHYYDPRIEKDPNRRLIAAMPFRETPITILDGKAGTTKSTVYREVVRQAVIDRHEVVAVVAEMHSSLDGSVKQLQDLPMLRIATRGERVDPDLKDVLLGNEDNALRYLALHGFWEKYKKYGSRGMVLCATAAGMARFLSLPENQRDFMAGRKIDLLVADETTQVILPSMVAIVQHMDPNGRLLVVGGEGQFTNFGIQGAERTRLQHQGISDAEMNTYSDNVFRFLKTTQRGHYLQLAVIYRSHPLLAKIIEGIFHPGQTIHSDNWQDIQPGTFRMVDIADPRQSRLEEEVEKPEEGEDGRHPVSFANSRAVQMDLESVRKYLELGYKPEDILIITPYSEQVRRIRRALKGEFPGAETRATVATFENVLANTVRGSQGTDELAVILDLAVRSNPEGSLGISSSLQLLYVGLTRSVRCLTVVVDHRMWERTKAKGELGKACQVVQRLIQAYQEWTLAFYPDPSDPFSKQPEALPAKLNGDAIVPADLETGELGEEVEPEDQEKEPTTEADAVQLAAPKPDASLAFLDPVIAEPAVLALAKKHCPALVAADLFAADDMLDMLLATQAGLAAKHLLVLFGCNDSLLLELETLGLHPDLAARGLSYKRLDEEATASVTASQIAEVRLVSGQSLAFQAPVVVRLVAPMNLAGVTYSYLVFHIEDNTIISSIGTAIQTRQFEPVARAIHARQLRLSEDMAPLLLEKTNADWPNIQTWQDLEQQARMEYAKSLQTMDVAQATARSLAAAAQCKKRAAQIKQEKPDMLVADCQAKVTEYSAAVKELKQQETFGDVMEVNQSLDDRYQAVQALLLEAQAKLDAMQLQMEELRTAAAEAEQSAEECGRQLRILEADATAAENLKSNAREAADKARQASLAAQKNVNAVQTAVQKHGDALENLTEAKALNTHARETQEILMRSCQQAQARLTALQVRTEKKLAAASQLAEIVRELNNLKSGQVSTLMGQVANIAEQHQGMQRAYSQELETRRQLRAWNLLRSKIFVAFQEYQSQMSAVQLHDQAIAEKVRVWEAENVWDDSVREEKAGILNLENMPDKLAAYVAAQRQALNIQNNAVLESVQALRNELAVAHSEISLHLSEAAGQIQAYNQEQEDWEEALAPKKSRLYYQGSLELLENPELQDAAAHIMENGDYATLVEKLRNGGLQEYFRTYIAGDPNYDNFDYLDILEELRHLAEKLRAFSPEQFSPEMFGEYLKTLRELDGRTADFIHLLHALLLSSQKADVLEKTLRPNLQQFIAAGDWLQEHAEIVNQSLYHHILLERALRYTYSADLININQVKTGSELAEATIYAHWDQDPAEVVRKSRDLLAGIAQLLEPMLIWARQDPLLESTLARILQHDYDQACHVLDDPGDDVSEVVIQTKHVAENLACLTKVENVPWQGPVFEREAGHYHHNLAMARTYGLQILAVIGFEIDGDDFFGKSAHPLLDLSADEAKVLVQRIRYSVELFNGLRRPSKNERELRRKFLRILAKATGASDAMVGLNRSLTGPGRLQLTISDQLLEIVEGQAALAQLADDLERQLRLCQRGRPEPGGIAESAEAPKTNAADELANAHEFGRQAISELDEVLEEIHTNGILLGKAVMELSKALGIDYDTRNYAASDEKVNAAINAINESTDPKFILRQSNKIIKAITRIRNVMSRHNGSGGLWSISREPLVSWLVAKRRMSRRAAERTYDFGLSLLAENKGAYAVAGLLLGLVGLGVALYTGNFEFLLMHGFKWGWILSWGAVFFPMHFVSREGLRAPPKRIWIPALIITLINLSLGFTSLSWWGLMLAAMAVHLGVNLASALIHFISVQRAVLARQSTTNIPAWLSQILTLRSNQPFLFMLPDIFKRYPGLHRTWMLLLAVPAWLASLGILRVAADDLQSDLILNAMARKNITEVLAEYTDYTGNPGHIRLSILSIREHGLIHWLQGQWFGYAQADAQGNITLALPAYLAAGLRHAAAQDAPGLRFAWSYRMFQYMLNYQGTAVSKQQKLATLRSMKLDLAAAPMNQVKARVLLDYLRVQGEEYLAPASQRQILHALVARLAYEAGQLALEPAAGFEARAHYQQVLEATNAYFKTSRLFGHDQVGVEHAIEVWVPQTLEARDLWAYIRLWPHLVLAENMEKRKQRLRPARSLATGA